MDLDIERAVHYVVHTNGRPCARCGLAVCGHEGLMSLVMGLQDAPRCLACLASGLDRKPDELRDGLLAYVQRRECLQAGWQEATRLEGFAEEILPGCLWPSGGGGPLVAAANDIRPDGEARQGSQPAPAAEWDAGDAGCGDLVMDLRSRLASLPPGAILKLTARDPGAPEDLPAWCRLTGHTLVCSEHPVYWIRRKEG